MRAYNVSKSGVDGLTRLWADRLRRRGIHVVSVDPGQCRTRMGPKDAPLSASQGAENVHKVLLNGPETDISGGVRVYTGGPPSGILVWKGQGMPWTFRKDKVTAARPPWVNICGIGATGKSTLLRAVQDKFGDNVLALELSTLDYIHVGGSKVHYFLVILCSIIG